MYNNYRPNSPFYSNNIFELFSSESEDSEQDLDWIEAMAASTVLNRATASSQVHKVLKSHLDENPIDDQYFADNIKTFKCLFGVKADLWTAFNNAKNNYVTEGLMSVRIEQATAIANAAVRIREENTQTATTVIKKSNAEVPLDGLDLSELDRLDALRKLVVSKMTGKPAPSVSQANNADQMVHCMNDDIKAIKITGFIPEKYLVNHYIWRCYEHARRKGIEIEDMSLESDHSCDNNIWIKIVDRWDLERKNAKPDSVDSSDLQKSANKFSVDVLVTYINTYKTQVDSDIQSCDHALSILKRVAAYTTLTTIGKSVWTQFLDANQDIKSICDGFNVKFKLFDNPGKLTKNRLFACAATVFKACDETSVFATGGRVRQTQVPKLIVKIYQIEERAGEIVQHTGHTSTCEHMLHILLTLGSSNNYAYNRNMIPSSAKDVMFTEVVTKPRNRIL